jgi:hypothetical protein
VLVLFLLGLALLPARSGGLVRSDLEAQRYELTRS